MWKREMYCVKYSFLIMKTSWRYSMCHNNSLLFLDKQLHGVSLAIIVFVAFDLNIYNATMF